MPVEGDDLDRVAPVGRQASRELVAAVGLTGGHRHRLDGNRGVEDEREVVVLARGLGRGEIGVGVAVEGELADLPILPSAGAW